MRTPKQKTSAQKRYEQLKSRGLCVACGKVPAQPGKTKCIQCRHQRQQVGAELVLPQAQGGAAWH